MNSLRSYWKICLLCLLLLRFGASRELPQLRGSGTNWQHCKNASQEIIEELWKLGIKPLALKSEPDSFLKIECEDHCDPESLGNENKMRCLQKINKGLRRYYDLLGLYCKPLNITDLRFALNKLSFLLQADLADTSSSIKCNPSFWMAEPLQHHTLWRLQSFSAVVARVFAHSAALNENVKIQQ